MSTKRKNQKNIELKMEDLEEVWERQNRTCPYSGIQLILPEGHKLGSERFYKYASLDRINPSKGYTKTNVEFVSRAINWMKNKYSKEETVEFLKITSEFVGAKTGN